MKLLESYTIWQDKKDDFISLRNYLIHTLEKLQIIGAIAFGSTVRSECSNMTNSDVDIVAYTALFTRETAQQCMDIITSQGGNFLDKAPLFLEDFISERIEFYYFIGHTTFDINIFPTQLGGYKNRYTNSTHDSLDVVIGAMYLEAGLLFGKVPFEELLKDEFLPFYCDELRKARMIQLEYRIRLSIVKIQNSFQNERSNLLYHIYKTRSYLIKWMFINARKYPVDLERYLNRQLSEVLEIPKGTTEVLLLENDSLEDAYQKFIVVTEQILSNANY